MAHKYSELHAIDQNRFRNNTSTVFEPESAHAQHYQQNQNRVDQITDNVGTSDDAEKYPENASPRNVPLWLGNGAPSKKHDNSYGTGKYYPEYASPRNVPLWSRNGAGAQQADQARKPVDSDPNVNVNIIYKFPSDDFFSSQCFLAH